MRIWKNKILRWVVYLTGSAVLFLTAVFLVLEYFFPSSFLISRIEAYMKENYNVGLKIERLEFRILSGIKIEKFRFTDNDMPDSLFSMESFTLKYDLIPLLDRKLVVKKIILEHPKINVVRGETGKFNFDGLVEKFSGKPVEKTLEEKKENDGKPDEKKESAPQFIIDLKNFELNNIDLSYEDRSIEAPMKAKLPLYNLKISGAEFKDADNFSADISFSTAQNNILSFSDRENAVKFRQEMVVKLAVKNQDVGLEFSHIIGELELKSPYANISRPGNIEIELLSHYNMKSDNLDIKNFAFTFADMVKAGLRGKVDGLTAGQVAEVTFSEIYADVSGLADFAERNGLADLMGAGIKDSECRITDLHVIHSVPENETKIKGNLAFSAAQATYRQEELSALVKNISLGSAFALDLKDNALTFSDISLDLGLENVSASVSGAKYRTGRQEIKLRPVLKSDFMPKSISYSHKISDIAEGKIELGLDASFDLSDTSLPALIKNTAASLNFKAEGLRPNTLEQSAPAGLTVSLNEKLYFSKGIVTNELELRTEFQSDTASVFSAADGRFIVSRLKADLNGLHNEFYKLDELTLKINDVLTAEIKNITADMKNNNAGIGKLFVSADLDGLLEIGKATGIPEIQPVMLYNGSLEVKAGGTGNISDMSANTEIKLDMCIDSLFYEDVSVNKGLKVNQTINLLSKDISLIGGIFVKGADYGGMLEEMGIKGDATIENNIRYTERGELRILKLGASVPGLETDVNIRGTADLTDSLYAFDLELTHRIGLKKSYTAVRGIDNIKGSVSGVTKLSGDLNSMNVSHTQSLADIRLVLELDSLGNKVRISGLKADIPLNAKLDLKEMRLLQYNKYPRTADFDFLDYSSMRRQYKISGLPVSNLTIDTVAVSHSLFKNDIRNIELDIFFDDNKFCLNRFYYELFDGNTAGFLRLNLGAGGIDDITGRAKLDLGLNMTGLNTYYLTRTKTKRSPSTEMNIIVKLSSNGLDIINEPDLNGEISISKISGDDAKYLLEFLNKNTGDQTAGMVKNMLNAFPGIKVDLFSFTIKNNFLYTLIKLKKPWYLVYFPLAEQISLSKQSIKFYLDKYVRDDL